MLVFILTSLLLLMVSSTAADVLPGGSWAATARNVRVKRLGYKVRGHDIFLLKAHLKTTTPGIHREYYWTPDETTFSLGDEFANEDGLFVPEQIWAIKSLQNKLVKIKRMTVTLNGEVATWLDSLSPKWLDFLSPLEVLIFLVPPFNLFWAGSMKRRLMKSKDELAATKAELRSKVKEITKLRKALIQAEIAKEKTILKLSKCGERVNRRREKKEYTYRRPTKTSVLLGASQFLKQVCGR